MAEYVGNMTRAYTADPDTFERESRAAYKDLWSLYDLNMDCLIEEDELVNIASSSVGHNNTITGMEYFDQFREPGGIVLNEIIEALVRFRTNVNKLGNDSSSAEIEKVAQSLKKI